MVLRRLAWFIVAAALGVPAGAEARDEDDCRRAWSQAVRSYLTANRRAAPDGSVPKDLDEAELAAQAWNAQFAPACRMEADGDKRGARVEAAVIGVQILARLDPRGCERFLEYYMQSSRSRDICGTGRSAGTAELRSKVAQSIPER